MNSPRRAFITGITGQDGSYLAELLLDKGYEVHGMVRRSSSFNRARIDHLYRDPHEPGVRMFLHYGDLSDSQSISNLILGIKPHEIYSLGAQSHVKVSFENPMYTLDVTGSAMLRILEPARQLAREQEVRIYQASSSEMFGKAVETPQNESTPFRPRSPYGCAKVYAYYQSVNYREAYGLFVSNGILFNHESPRRGESFVTRKITRAATRIKLGLQKTLYLGNLDAQRDWGFAGDYVEAMWRMLQADEADDFVIATNQSHSIRAFLDLAFGQLELDWREFVEVDPNYYRPTEVDVLRGDYSKACRVLGWSPTTAFEELVRMMVDADLKLAERERREREVPS